MLQKTIAALFLSAALLTLTTARADDPPAAHAKLLGIARVTFYVHDLHKSVAFYKNYLGFEPVMLDTTPPSMIVPVSDDQSLQFIENPNARDRLVSISLRTDNVDQLRQEMAAKGITVPPATQKIPTGETAFAAADPDGHTLQFLQGDMRRENIAVPAHQVALSYSHVGIIVGDVETSLHFYRDLLGFREFWRGANNPATLSWVQLTLPDSKNYFEFMLYSAIPDPDKRGSQHHICLNVPDVVKTYQEITSRPLPDGVKAPTPPKVGINRKRQINTFDPDGTRIEIMEFNTIDGVPPPPSTLPAPTHAATQPN